MAPPVSLDLEEELEEEEEIALDSEADEVPLSVGDDEEIALETDEAPGDATEEEHSLLELDVDGEADLGGGFLDEEPLAADTDLLSEPDLAQEVAERAPEPDFAAVEDEIELPDTDLALSEPPLLEQPEEIALQDDEELEIPEPETEPPAAQLEASDEFELPGPDASLFDEPLAEPEGVGRRGSPGRDGCQR